MNKIALILCGGSINYSQLPIGTNRSNSMIPVNGKPVIGWIMDDLEEKEFKEAVIVLQYDNLKLYNYLHWAYSDRMILHFAFVQPQGTILHSLLAGLAWVRPPFGVHVVLGDTLIRDTLVENLDFVLTGDYAQSENWCLVEFDQSRMVKKYYDKEIVDNDQLEALAGVYSLSDASTLREVVMSQITAGKKELSAVLSEYGKIHSIKAIHADQWYDFGHIDDFNKAKRNLLQSRYFNSLEINPILGVIKKRSDKSDKLKDELNWYKSLPEKLQIFSPRILQDQSTGESITQEYYGYPNLAELYVFGDLDISVWRNALRQIFNVHKLFKAEHQVVDTASLHHMYIDKTQERLDLLRNMHEWKPLLKSPTLEINGASYSNIDQGWLLIKKQVGEMEKNFKTGSIIHGDFCFSNILYDLNTQVVRLIDPRGSFGKKGISGDPRYDMAKLSHSLSGLYDFIMADLFLLEEKGNQAYSLKIYQPEKYAQINLFFDQLLGEMGYNRNEISLLEGLLFLSMVPYHQGKPKRQKAMYLTGIMLLQETPAL